jgi:hypothetical protein
MATIKIQRTSEWNARLRDFKIFIDGKLVGTISNGETKEFTTSDGIHTITAKIDWCSSPDITIKSDENKSKILKVSGFKHGNWMLPVAMVIIVLVFILKWTTGIQYLEYSIILVIPVFNILMYYITVGRNKYLRLYEM